MGMYQGSVLLPILYAVVVDVVTEFARENAMSVLLYADDLVLMNETIVGLRNKFLIRKGAFESKGMKVNHGKTKKMVSGRTTKDGMSQSKAYPCGASSLRVKANSVLWSQCGKWIHGRCDGLKSVTLR